MRNYIGGIDDSLYSLGGLTVRQKIIKSPYNLFQFSFSMRQNKKVSKILRFQNSSFQDSINPLCSSSLNVESTVHYFLHYPLFTIERYTLLNTISQIDNKLLESNGSNLTQNLLFGDPSNNRETNTEILNATVNYV